VEVVPSELDTVLCPQQLTDFTNALNASNAPKSVCHTQLGTHTLASPFAFDLITASN